LRPSDDSVACRVTRPPQNNLGQHTGSARASRVDSGQSGETARPPCSQSSAKVLTQPALVSFAIIRPVTAHIMQMKGRPAPSRRTSRRCGRPRPCPRCAVQSVHQKRRTFVSPCLVPVIRKMAAFPPTRNGVEWQDHPAKICVRSQRPPPPNGGPQAKKTSIQQHWRGHAGSVGPGRPGYGRAFLLQANPQKEGWPPPGVEAWVKSGGKSGPVIDCSARVFEIIMIHREHEPSSVCLSKIFSENRFPLFPDPCLSGIRLRIGKRRELGPGQAL